MWVNMHLWFVRLCLQSNFNVTLSITWNCNLILDYSRWQLHIHSIKAEARHPWSFSEAIARAWSEALYTEVNSERARNSWWVHWDDYLTWWHPIVMMKTSHSFCYLVTGRSKSKAGEGVCWGLLWSHRWRDNARSYWCWSTTDLLR